MSTPADWSLPAASFSAPVLGSDQSACPVTGNYILISRSSCPTNGVHFNPLFALAKDIPVPGRRFKPVGIPTEILPQRLHGTEFFGSRHPVEGKRSVHGSWPVKTTLVGIITWASLRCCGYSIYVLSVGHRALPLLHYTKTKEAVANILLHGFAYVALPTKTASFLLPRFPKQPREPEQFGAISFRCEEDDKPALRHCQKYGLYGIAVDESWALDVGAQPVRYIRSWGLTALWFRLAVRLAARKIYEEMDRYPDDSFRAWAFHNAAAAGIIGAGDYAKLMLIYRYTAPFEDRHENEWRIANRHPNYSIPTQAAEAVKQVSPPMGWAIHMNVIKLPPNMLRYLVVPSGEATALRELLAERFKDAEIRERHSPNS